MNVIELRMSSSVHRSFLLFASLRKEWGKTWPRSFWGEGDGRYPPTCRPSLPPRQRRNTELLSTWSCVAKARSAADVKELDPPVCRRPQPFVDA